MNTDKTIDTGMCTGYLMVCLCKKSCDGTITLEDVKQLSSGGVLLHYANKEGDIAVWDGELSDHDFKSGYESGLRKAVEVVEQLVQDPEALRRRIFAAQDFPNWSDATESGAFAFSYNSAIDDATQELQSLLPKEDKPKSL